MRLSRKDLVPVVAIVAGGVIGASLSFSFLGSRPGDVPYEPSATSEWEARGASRVGTVTGEVTDAQTGASVMAAQIFIASLNLGVLSQRNGRYLLQNVPTGTYTLTLVRIGYRTTEVQITVGGGQTLDQDFSIAERPLKVNFVIRQRKDGRFVKAMEERGSVIPFDSFPPGEVRP